MPWFGRGSDWDFDGNIAGLCLFRQSHACGTYFARFGDAWCQADSIRESSDFSRRTTADAQSSGSGENFFDELYRPGSARYGKYIDPAEFGSRFGATPEEIDSVIRYFQRLGCVIPHPYAYYPLLIDVQCGQATLEQALKIKIAQWENSRHELIQTIDTDPTIPDDVPIEAIHGLTSVPRHPHYVKAEHPQESPPVGSGPNGGLAPSDFRTAYHLNGISANGAGQTLGVFELDGYQPTDITAYESNFGIAPAVPLTNVLIDGFNGSAGENAAEVCLDIELMSAVAPRAKQILVYEGLNTDAGVINVYQKIATDNLAKEISTSWGGPEDQTTPATLQTENRIFMQMAAQGQSVFAASGDSGALDDQVNLSVDDPAAQPYVTGTGGTALTMNPDHSYLKETTWWSGGVGGGGGISATWPLRAGKQGWLPRPIWAQRLSEMFRTSH